METVIRVENLSKTFVNKKRMVKAVSNVNFSINKGECLGIIGESGSGKSTVASILAGFSQADEGKCFFCEKDLADKRILKQCQKQMQMIFQNPKTSLNPKMKIGENIAEALRYYTTDSLAIRKQKVKETLKEVGLLEEYIDRFPSQLSGGECQRVAIARAIIRKPEFLICDEITSALDVSVQAQVMELFQRLQKQMQLTILFISHDLTLVSSVCDRIIVMEKGRIVEEGETIEVLSHPKNNYTKSLIKAANLKIE